MAVKKLKHKMSPVKAAPKKTAAKKPPAKKPPAPKAAPKAAMEAKAKAKAKAKARAPGKPRAAAATAAPSANEASKEATKEASKKPWLFPPVVHWEIQATNAGHQRAFYSDLFGWPIDANNPQNYGMVGAAGDGAIGGGIGAAPEGDGKSYVTFYVEVPDIDAYLSKAESLGAATVMPRTDIGMVVLAQFRDPEGNIIGLIESAPSPS